MESEDMYKGRMTGKACASVQQGGDWQKAHRKTKKVLNELTIIITDLSIYNCQSITNITTNVHAYDVWATSSTGDHDSRGIHSFIHRVDA